MGGYLVKEIKEDVASLTIEFEECNIYNITSFTLATRFIESNHIDPTSNTFLKRYIEDFPISALWRFVQREEFNKFCQSSQNEFLKRLALLYRVKSHIKTVLDYFRSYFRKLVYQDYHLSIDELDSLKNELIKGVQLVCPSYDLNYDLNHYFYYKEKISDSLVRVVTYEIRQIVKLIDVFKAYLKVDEDTYSCQYLQIKMRKESCFISYKDNQFDYQAYSKKEDKDGVNYFTQVDNKIIIDKTLLPKRIFKNDNRYLLLFEVNDKILI